MVEQFRTELKARGCSTELFSSRRFIAVNVPGEASLASVQDFLTDLETRDLASFEEPILRQ